METTYWNQWTTTELLSIHGVEQDEIQINDEDDAQSYRRGKCDCSNCMYCLGFSWADFM